MRTAEGAVSPYSMISLRELLTAVFKERRNILISIGATLALSLVVALMITPKYVASSSLLVLLGPEYGFQATAGQASVTNASLGREEFLRSEVEILNSQDLHEAVLRKVGLAAVYPDYIPGSGFFETLGRGFNAIILGIYNGLGLGSKSAPVDPVARAAPEFAANFEAQPLKEGSVIEVTFKHKDPRIAAEVLNTLVALYLADRTRLYADVQSTMIGDQVKAHRRQLDELDQKTEAFKAANGAFNYDMQRDILLHQRGDLQNDAAEARRTIAQAGQRIAQLKASLAGTAENEMQYSDTDVDGRLDDLHTTLNGLYKERADRRMRYQDNSLLVREVQQEIDELNSRIDKIKQDGSSSISRIGRNPNYDALDIDRVHAQADLRGATARLDSDVKQLAGVEAEMARLNTKETELAQLERQQTVADADYRDLVKQLSDRSVIEDVQKRKVANVRVIQPAVPPLKPQPIRRLLILGGAVLSLFVAAAVVFITELTRNNYFAPEQIERGLGLAVLVSIPDRAVLANDGRFLGTSLPKYEERGERGLQQ